MELLNKYDSIDLIVLEEYVNKSKEENLYLEFKLIKNPDFTIKEDKKNYATALSGFSNSSGGIMVWGIVAKKNNQGIDCAIELNPIRGITSLISKLNELTGDFVSPIIDNVLHKKVYTDESNDEGFVVSYIPESDSGPHMAKAGLDRYYKRSGDSFYRMEHFDIEDMFGRRRKPKLKLFVDLKTGGSEGGKKNVNFIIGLKNIGRGIAKYPFIELELNEPYKFSTYDFHEVNKHRLN